LPLVNLGCKSGTERVNISVMEENMNESVSERQTDWRNRSNDW